MEKTDFWDITPCSSCKNLLSKEGIASIIRVTRIGELVTTLAVTSTEVRCAYRSNLLKIGIVND
jgi:hypothetical protein